MQLNQIAEQKEKMIKEEIVNRSELLEQKRRIEEKIRKSEKKNIDDKITSSLRKIQDINDSISDLQFSLNTIWKRTKQIERNLTKL